MTELICENDYSKYVTHFYLQEKRGHRTVLIGYNGRDLVETVLDDIMAVPDVEIIPLLSVPMPMANMIMKAFADKALNLNISTENENLLKGKLEATEYHLADMREITKKLLKI